MLEAPAFFWYPALQLYPQTDPTVPGHVDERLPLGTPEGQLLAVKEINCT